MTSRSSELFAAAQERIPGGVNSPVRAFRHVGAQPFFVERARGAKIWDVDGNEYIDYIGSWGPAILGHAPKVIVDAVREAAARGLSFGIPNPLEVEMANLICAWMPSIEKVRMVNSGTEATMACVRLARGFTGRDKIIKFDGCYHGHVDALLVRSGSGALTHGRPDSAGVPQQEIYGVKPDLTALGKIIGGGLPVGAFGGSAAIMDQLSPDGPVYQAGTLSGNPLAMTAGLAQLHELERIDGWKLLERLGAHFEKLTRDAIAQAKIDITFHRIGSMFCLFFASGPIVDLADAQRSNLETFSKFFRGCLKRGVYFAPSQFETGFISTAHTREDIERTCAVMRESLSEL